MSHVVVSLFFIIIAIIQQPNDNVRNMQIVTILSLPLELNERTSYARARELARTHQSIYLCNSHRATNDETTSSKQLNWIVKIQLT